jgi:hypothetical protein
MFSFSSSSTPLLTLAAVVAVVIALYDRLDGRWFFISLTSTTTVLTLAAVVVVEV